MNNLIAYLSNKKILILGFGREGISTYNFLRSHFNNMHLYIADKLEDLKTKHDFLQNDANVTIISGKNYLNDLDSYDIIIKSPGISFAGMDTSSFIDKITSELELLLTFFPNYTIGITGTKGKSTTSSLIYKILKDQNKKSLLLGNIGIPVFDYIDKIDEDSVLVLEMSSHQLEFMKHSPNISLLLNIYEEHLDHYNSYEEYIYAKCNIFKYQTENDYFIYNTDDEMLKKYVKDIIIKTYKVSFNNKEDMHIENGYIYDKDEKIIETNFSRLLIGEFNLYNIMFALKVAKILNLDINKAITSISEFKPLAHRLELVGTYNGVTYYDNSIATIPMATIEAVKALKNVDSLIIGGMDRGIDYTPLIEFINKSDISNIICMPTTGHNIAKSLKTEKTFIVETLEEAVSIAKEVTKKGSICLLSPAAASYGFFKDFEERGNKFQELIKGSSK